MIEIKGDNGFIIHIEESDIKAFGIEPKIEQVLYIIYADRQVTVSTDVQSQYNKLYRYFNSPDRKIGGIRQ